MRPQFVIEVYFTATNEATVGTDKLKTLNIRKTATPVRMESYLGRIDRNMIIEVQRMGATQLALEEAVGMR